jgi:Tfp pilus assembly protein PilF
MPRLDQLLALLATDPDDAFLRYGVGMEYLQAGRHADAIAAFDDLLARDAAYAPAYFMRGRAYEQSGDLVRARASYQQGITTARANGDHHAADEMTAALEALA